MQPVWNHCSHQQTMLNRSNDQPHGDQNPLAFRTSFIHRTTENKNHPSTEQDVSPRFPLTYPTRTQITKHFRKSILEYGETSRMTPQFKNPSTGRDGSIDPNDIDYVPSPGGRSHQAILRPHDFDTKIKQEPDLISTRPNDLRGSNIGIRLVQRNAEAGSNTPIKSEPHTPTIPESPI